MFDRKSQVWHKTRHNTSSVDIISCSHLSAVAGETQVVALLHRGRHPVAREADTARPTPAPPPPYTRPAPDPGSLVHLHINIRSLPALPTWNMSQNNL